MTGTPQFQSLALRLLAGAGICLPSPNPNIDSRLKMSGMTRKIKNVENDEMGAHVGNEEEEKSRLPRKERGEVFDF